MIKKIEIWDTPVYLVGDLYKKDKLDNDELDLGDLKNCTLFFLGNMVFANKEDAMDKFAKLDQELYERNIISYVIKGDSDNPELWADETKWPSFKSFQAVDSNTRIELNGNRGIIISGAINPKAVDVKGEIEHFRHKVDMPPDIVDYGENLKKIDFVIGHSGPVLSDFFKDRPELQKLYLDKGFFKEVYANEQKEFRAILKRYRPNRWYCGHYNISKDTKFVWDNWSDDGAIHLKILKKNEIMRIA